jgi:hypothetical protein
MSLIGFTLLGTIKTPSLGAGITANNVPLMVKPNTEFTSAMLSSLDENFGNLRFSSDELGSTQLACEIVSSNFVWVSTSGLSVSSGTTLYVWAGNTGVSQPIPSAAFGRNEVWSDREFQYNLHDVSSVFDSSGNAASGGTIIGSPTSNQTSPMGSGVELLSGDSIDLDEPLGATTGDLTLRAWINAGEFQSYAPIIHLADGSNWSYQWRLESRDHSILIGASSPNSPAPNIARNIWVQLALVVSGTTISYYTDGVFQGTQNVSGNRSTSATTTKIGSNNALSQTVSSTLAGVSASFNASSADQIYIEYQNQSSTTAWWIASDAVQSVNTVLVTSWSKLSTREKLLVTSWSKLSTREKLLVTSWSKLSTREKSIVTSWSKLLNREKLLDTSWSKLLSSEKLLVTSWSKLSTREKSIVTSWSKIAIGDVSGSVITSWSKLSNKEKSLVTSWTKLKNTLTPIDLKWSKNGLYVIFTSKQQWTKEIIMGPSTGRTVYIDENLRTLYIFSESRILLIPPP